MIEDFRRIIYTFNIDHKFFLKGETKVVSAIYGPVEVKINKEVTDHATIICVLKPKVGMAGIYVFIQNSFY